MEIGKTQQPNTTAHSKRLSCNFPSDEKGIIPQSFGRISSTSFCGIRIHNIEGHRLNLRHRINTEGIKYGIREGYQPRKKALPREWRLFNNPENHKNVILSTFNSSSENRGSIIHTDQIANTFKKLPFTESEP